MCCNRTYQIYGRIIGLTEAIALSLTIWKVNIGEKSSSAPLRKKSCMCLKCNYFFVGGDCSIFPKEDKTAILASKGNTKEQQSILSNQNTGLLTRRNY